MAKSLNTSSFVLWNLNASREMSGAETFFCRANPRRVKIDLTRVYIVIQMKRIYRDMFLMLTEGLPEEWTEGRMLLELPP
ncbi:hypothetical protein CEXT_319321 [Caerostris extrusa]|uniref:Uncharacterized protein n=1 Tax=Caerostris extrusa TaxID=172846 RepID=A0AAV4RA83_CAEEX|nr:hypothetical protein CEXT_319321 [Caerostris extrusa]